MGQEGAGKSLATLLPVAKLTRLPPWVPVACGGCPSRKPTCFFAGCGPLFRPTMDETPAKETPGEGLNKIDLSQLQDFRFGTQWTEIKSVPGSRREFEGESRPDATGGGRGEGRPRGAGGSGEPRAGSARIFQRPGGEGRWPRRLADRRPPVAMAASAGRPPGEHPPPEGLSGAGVRRNVRAWRSPMVGAPRAPAGLPAVSQSLLQCRVLSRRRRVFRAGESDARLVPHL